MENTSLLWPLNILDIGPALGRIAAKGVFADFRKVFLFDSSLRLVL